MIKHPITRSTGTGVELTAAPARDMPIITMRKILLIMMDFHSDLVQG